MKSTEVSPIHRDVSAINVKFAIIAKIAAIFETWDVPLGRVKKAEDLAILRPSDMKVLQVQPLIAQITELKRLDELDRKTQRECAHFTC